MSSVSAPAPASTPPSSRRPDPSSERSLESLGLTVGAVGFIVIALVAIPVFGLQAAPIAGPDSVGQFAALSSAAVGFVAFFAGRFLMRAQGQGPAEPSLLDYLDVAALALAHGIIALLSWLLLASIFEQSFIGAQVFPLALLVLAGAAAAITGYLVFFSATHMDLSLLAVILAVFLVEGVVASMLTASDPQWWMLNLSALGMTDDLSARAFNLTLVIAGFLVTTLARYATRGIPTPHPHGQTIVRVLLIIVGVFLACVGIFHVDTHFALHNTVASGMVVAFAVAVVGLRWWIPGMPRAFFALGYTFLAVIVVLAVMFFTGTYTLTAVELVAGALVFSWIVLFIRNAGALHTDAAREAAQ